MSCIFFQPRETPVLTSVLLFSSEVQQRRALQLACLGLCQQSFSCSFFPPVFLPSGLATMQIYFRGSTFPPDFLSLHPSNQNSHTDLPVIRATGAHPVLGVPREVLSLFVSTISLSFFVAELSMAAGGLFFQLFYFA